MSVHSEEEGSSEDKENKLFEIPDSCGPVDSRHEEGDFILVKFNVGTRKIFYVAKVIGEGSKREVEVSYLRKSSKIRNSFLLPDVPDIATVVTDIKLILPKQIFSEGTKKQQGVYKFDIDFSRIDLR
ncbi:unnamed protein product [Acanthoscelides obtectus]|uniref:Uncharacterized protein n=1 Tax=Acanthoscelides obtectus TaxID=200917 RepID=A0A9P0KP23_ACAOB|nr:unnamed protein product [Acanthoscelides obtectus]CAK1641689.1 hypothetical protein AOBTE_LOCUS12559 [Acanthoscelides obtectus]